MELKADGTPYKTPKPIREAIKRYQHTEKGKATRARYRKKKYWEDPEKARAIVRAKSHSRYHGMVREFPLSYVRHIRITIPVTVMVEKDGESYHAWCPALEGLHTEGYCLINAVANAKLAAEAYLLSMIKHDELIPSEAKNEKGEKHEENNNHRRS